MAYDLIIKNGTVIDGTGAPRRKADVGVSKGRLVEIGKVSGRAGRVIDAEGMVVAPGFIDNHCHYDAQVTWDPLCTSSCYHGATSVVFGNCSLALAPVRPQHQDQLLQMLSYVEAIPIDTLRKGVRWGWESLGQYYGTLERSLSVNVGSFVGHSAVRYYVMGPASQERPATAEELKEEQRLVHEALGDGALGVSMSRNTGHFDPQGRLLPAIVAPEDEMFTLAEVVRQFGAGTIQVGSGRDPALKSGLCTRLSQGSGRPVVYGQVSQYPSVDPYEWRRELDAIEAACKAGSRAFPMFSPRKYVNRFNMKNCQTFIYLPAWKAIATLSDEEKLRAYSDPQVRRGLYEEAVENKGGHWRRAFAGQWDLLRVTGPVLEKNAGLRGKSIVQIAQEQGKNLLDAFLDLAVEERLETGFEIEIINTNPKAVAAMIQSPYVVVGLSDGGAHVVFDIGCGYSTGMIAQYVREEHALTLEAAVHKLTGHTAEAFGITDRGLLKQGLAADIVVFDPEAIAPNEPVTVNDLPGGAPRLMQTATGIKCTVVNGQVLMEDGKPTGATPGHVLRNEQYLKRHGMKG